MFNAFLTFVGQAPQRRPPYPSKLRAKRQSLEYIRPMPYASVDMDG